METEKQKISLSIQFIILLQNRSVIIQSSLRPLRLAGFLQNASSIILIYLSIVKIKALSLNAPKHFCNCHDGIFSRN